MHTLGQKAAVAVWAGLTLALAGCGGAPLASGGTAIAPQSVSMTAPAGAGRVFVSDFNASTVEIYPQGKPNPAPIGSISAGIAGPVGSAVDDKRTLYVTNASNNTITEYPAGSTSPSVTISNGLNYPTAIAVSHGGTIAVSEFPSGAIVEYAPGKSSPSLTMTSLTYPEGLTFDSGGHLYAAWNVNNGNGLSGHVSKCAPLSANCTDLGISAGQSGGLALDSAGDVVLGDQTNSVVNIYAPRRTKPLRTISTAGHDPAKLALDAAQQRLYVDDIAGSAVVVYDYAAGAQDWTIARGLQSATGVSLSPPARYGP